MVVFPKAKINLGLRITGKRTDGYHNIETIFYPVGFSDALEFVSLPESNDRDILTVTGISLGIGTEQNIVMKALSDLRAAFSFPRLRLHLHKAIPHGAGLGGGSSDAACLLKALNRFFAITVSDADLKSMALEIGSDCPFFLYGYPAFGSGRGELLEAIDPLLSGYYLILINPGVVINTREAYMNCKPAMPDSSLLLLARENIKEWKHFIFNDFEEYAFKKHPSIGAIKSELYSLGALYSSMSGSGSSVYGIFPARPPVIPARLNDMLIWQGVL